MTTYSIKEFKKGTKFLCSSSAGPSVIEAHVVLETDTCFVVEYRSDIRSKYGNAKYVMKEQFFKTYNVIEILKG